MATTTLKVSFTELQLSLASFFGASRTIADWHANVTADVNLLIRGALRTIYGAYQWSFLREDYTIVTTPPYSTGTITVVAGSATLAGGTWPTWAASGWLCVNNIPYEVATRSSGSVIILDDTALAFSAGTTYELRRFSYTMPVDFAGFNTPLAYSPGESYREFELHKTGVHEIRRLNQVNGAQNPGPPSSYALFVVTPDPTVGEMRAVALYPFANAAYHVTAERYLIPKDLDGTSLYPSGGALYADVFLTGVLAQYELKKLRITNGPQQQAFAVELQKAIESDKLISTPDTLGPFVGCPTDIDRATNPPYNGDYVTFPGLDIFG